MTALTASLEALKDELMPAIRRDHERHRGRRTVLRASAASLMAFGVLAGSALAAGDALGIINLGGGLSAAPVSTVPLWDGATGTFVTTQVNGEYAYHVTGGSAPPHLSCGLADPHPTNNIYITSPQPLTESQLSSLVLLGDAVVTPATKSGILAAETLANSLGVSVTNGCPGS